MGGDSWNVDGGDGDGDDVDECDSDDEDDADNAMATTTMAMTMTMMIALIRSHLAHYHLPGVKRRIEEQDVKRNTDGK